MTSEKIKYYMSKNSLILDELDLDTKVKASKFVNDVYNNLGVLMLLYDGFRTFEEQKALYEKYLAGGSKAAPPTLSFHEYRRAFDAVPLNNDGTANWKPDQTTLSIIHGYAEKNGLCTGHKYGDDVHYQNIGKPTTLYCDTYTISQYLKDNNIPLSNSSEFQNTIVPSRTNTIMTTALIGGGLLTLFFLSKKKKKK